MRETLAYARCGFDGSTAVRVESKSGWLLVALLATATPVWAQQIAVSVDPERDVRAFSRDIFGVAYGNDARFEQMGYTVRRWGGNATTRYNWRVDVHNTANDWFYENIPGASDRSQVPPLGNAADAYIATTLAAGAKPLITIPTIGWTPRADSSMNHPYFAGFSVAKYGTQQQVDPWDPDAGNGVRPNGALVVGNEPSDTSSAVGPAFWQEWIAHLRMRFGNGVRMYALDNEPMLWNSTHRDIHPAAATYDEIWAKAASYGTAIKQQDPGALVFGPVSWGYCDLFGSAADECMDGPDRQAHGGLPFIAWYLQQVCANPLPGGRRLVDFLDLHWYPEGQNVSGNDDDSAATAVRRLRALKELYDPTWVSESWIADLGDWDANHYDKPNFIPRVRAWIDQYCPGTKLAITEYNFGGDNTASGAVAQAELFGIFAREGVDLAARWVAPEPNTRAERAFTLFLDYDGAGAEVQGSSVYAASGNVDQIGAYAFADSSRRMVLLTNKTTGPRPVAVSFPSALDGTWKLYGFDAANPVHLIASGTITGTTPTLPSLPAMSASLLVIELAQAPESRVFSNGFEPN